MHRAAALVSLMLVTVCAHPQDVFTSDAKAVALAKESVTALLGGSVLQDATLSATVAWFAGPDAETGTGLFEAKGHDQSRVELALNNGSQTEVRNASMLSPACTGQIGGGTPKRIPEHNCWIDPVWFFPALSSLDQTSTPAFFFEYFGQEERDGASVDHIMVFHSPPRFKEIEGLTAMDFYLDPQSHLPLSLAFDSHPDTDMNAKVRVMINFGDYRVVSGVQVPFHIQRLVNGSVVLDATITRATFNTGLADSRFILH